MQRGCELPCSPADTAVPLLSTRCCAPADLTLQLLDVLQASAPSRIVWVNSVGSQLVNPPYLGGNSWAPGVGAGDSGVLTELCRTVLLTADRSVISPSNSRMLFLCVLLVGKKGSPFLSIRRRLPVLGSTASVLGRGDASSSVGGLSCDMCCC